MTLDRAICERARKARDRRFDGRFYIGVVTTGIYCRPICPASRAPRARNVRYLISAAAAEEEGFRPCRRCRPESAPGTPAWLGSSATVSRALRLIRDGALDAGSVGDLAGRLGIGERHLRRLFGEHVGASPVSVARTRRAHFARRLIDETSLPMTQVALAAGYGSVRKFNQAVRETFRATPSELRRGARATARAEAQGGVRLRLPLRLPFDWQALLAFLSVRAIPGVERVGEGEYARSFREGARAGVLRVGFDPEGPWLLLEVASNDSASMLDVVERVRRQFDVDSDLLAIGSALSGDPLLAPLVAAHPGLRVPTGFDRFEVAVRCLLGQQVSVKGASTLAGRIARAFGRALPSELCETGADEPTHAFPDAPTLADAALDDLGGMPRARASAIRGLARAVADGDLALDGAAPLDESLAALRALPGVGEWSAQLIAMRALGEPDAFPAGDLGLRKALGEGGTPLAEKRARERAEGWRPWRSYAAMWLWSCRLGAARRAEADPSRPTRAAPRPQEWIPCLTHPSPASSSTRPSARSCWRPGRKGSAAVGWPKMRTTRSRATRRRAPTWRQRGARSTPTSKAAAGTSATCPWRPPAPRSRSASGRRSARSPAAPRARMGSSRAPSASLGRLAPWAWRTTGTRSA